MNQINSEYKDGNIVITIPADLLIFAQKNRPDIEVKIKKKDMDVMGNYIAKHFVDFDEDQEDGTTRLQQMLDDMFEIAYEDGEEWLEFVEE